MLNNDNKINLCFLDDYPSLTEGILSLVKISKNQIKKSSLSKKQLQRKILKRDEVCLPLDLLNYLIINPVFMGSLPKIIFEDEELLGLSKPVRVHCHPLSYCESDNLLSFMRAEGKDKELRVNQKQYDRGLLYRLDYETSGLVLYAKNNELYDKVRADFKTYVVNKTYLAIVDGKCEVEGRLTHYLKSSGPKGEKVDVFEINKDGSLEVECEIKVKNYNSEENLSLIEIKLFQGHRHQIRKQLQAIGHTILGDPIYGKRSSERMFLHCWKYTLNLGVEKTIVDSNLGLFSLFFNSDS